MARKTKIKVIEELKKSNVEFDETAKYDDLAALLKLVTNNEEQAKLQEMSVDTGFSIKVIKAALDAGFVDKQIEKFTDEESLKQSVIRHKPGLAARFIEKPEVKSREIVMVDTEIEFDVSILAGFGPISDHMRKESLEIERMIRRRGISVFDIQKMVIERNMTASDDGRKHSKVLIKYRKEE